MKTPIGRRSSTGGWRVADPTGTLHVDTVDSLRARDRDAVEAEGRRLLHLLAPGADHEVRLEVVG